MLTNTEKQAVIDLLMGNRERYISTINFVRDYPVTSVATIGQSLVIRGHSDRDWVYLALGLMAPNAPNSQGDLPAVVASLTTEDTCFAMVNDVEKAAILAGAAPKWVLSCHKLICPETIEPIDAKLTYEGAILRALDPTESAYIFAHYDYSAFTDEDYIRERIELGPSLGIEVGGRLVAWLLTHDDGAMGMLTVLEAYRRHGFAAVLTTEMICVLRRKGLIPFVAIEPTNEKSMGLALKSGFVDCGLYHWFER